jgi:hypothetical protein
MSGSRCLLLVIIIIVVDRRTQRRHVPFRRALNFPHVHISIANQNIVQALAKLPRIKQTKPKSTLD